MSGRLSLSIFWANENFGGDYFIGHFEETRRERVVVIIRIQASGEGDGCKIAAASHGLRPMLCGLQRHEDHDE
jgi:hypothetical protein